MGRGVLGLGALPPLWPQASGKSNGPDHRNAAAVENCQLTISGVKAPADVERGQRLAAKPLGIGLCERQAPPGAAGIVS